MNASFLTYRIAAAFLEKRLEEEGMEKPLIGIICGSGLSGLSALLENHGNKTLVVPYSTVPGFPKQCTVPGHVGEIVFGKLSGVPTICFRGRFHSYEGHDIKTVVLPTLTMRCLGVQICIATNAAGGLNPKYNVGDVVAISDHLALPLLTGNHNPLVGQNDDELGPRFPPTSNAYPESLRNVAKQAADKLDINFFIPEGTYCFVSGPQYESKAECRFLRSLGGDAVGMSTVPEIVTAHHSNMMTLCLSLITNKVVMNNDDKGAAVASHAEVLEVVNKRSAQMQTFVEAIVAIIGIEILPKLPTQRKISLEQPTSFDEKIDEGQEATNSISEDKKVTTKTTTSIIHHHNDTRIWISAALVAAALSVGVTMRSSRM